jgi:hypothetical protein
MAVLLALADDPDERPAALAALATAMRAALMLSTRLRRAGK